jgi:cytochrome b561
MRHPSVLEYRQFRYLKAALVLTLAGLASYIYMRPSGEAVPYPFGATVTGYALGITAAMLMLILTLFGLRKRRYAAGRSTLSGWLSAHVYLGISVPVLATLHCGFSFGWNIHTTAYVLMMCVVLSGVWGMYRYTLVPRDITENIGEQTLEQCMDAITELDRQIRRDVLELPDDINTMTETALSSTRIGGGVLAQLRSRDSSAKMRETLKVLEQRGAAGKAEQGQRVRDLYSLISRRSALVERASRDIQLRARLQFWLIFHVPITLAMWVALIAHVTSVLYYW